MKLKIKPLSVNAAFTGRRFKTKEYKQYKQVVLMMLPKLDIPKDTNLQLEIKAGFSSKGSDLDNIAKQFIDILSHKYKFNDNKIYKLIMTKEIVKKGDEYISFNISGYSELNELLDNPLF